MNCRRLEILSPTRGSGKCVFEVRVMGDEVKGKEIISL